MFDLEKAVKQWRQSLRKNQALEDGYMEELESHLRDKIDHLTEQGISEEKAFTEAVDRIGDRDLIGEEYFKADTRKLSSRPPWKKDILALALIPNYFKTAFRKIKRQKVFSFINITGLAVGLACCAVIILYVVNELTYDTFHKDADRIFRINAYQVNQVGEFHMAATPGPLGPMLKSNFPQVEDITRVVPPYENPDSVLVVRNDKRFFESRVFFVDNAAFRIFHMPFLKGSPDQALIRPHTVVLTEPTAKKYFGEEDPVGKILQIEIDYDIGIDRVELQDYEVTGVIKDAPVNTHFKYDMLLSLPTFLANRRDFDTDWINPHIKYNYIKLQEETDPMEFKENLVLASQEVTSRYEERINRKIDMAFDLQPISRIHMSSHELREMEASGNWYYVTIYSLVAFLILLIGCMNFVNLSAALSATRTREVGLRKVIGAQRRQLMGQFLGESSLITLVAFVFSLVLMIVLLGPFNRMAGTELSIAGLARPLVFVPMMALLVLVALGSGAYPALILTAFKPADVLQGRLAPKTRGTGVQKVLVVGQFAISVFLVICTLTVFKQLGFMQGQALGFDINQKLILRVKSNLDHLRRDYEAIKQDFLASPYVTGATVSSSVPGDHDENGYYMTTREEDFSDSMRLKVNTVDYDFIPEYGIKLIAGRPFQKENRSDTNEAFVINRAGLKELGIPTPEDALGKRYQAHYHRRWKTIVGVTENFHYRGMQEAVEPLLLDIETSLMDNLTLSVNTENMNVLMRDVRTSWEEHFPGVPMVYSFLDENFDRVYRYESQMGRMLSITTTLGLIIACLGLFGLAYFVANFKRKEIGIRKVLGASDWDIVGMLSKRFAGLVLISVVVAGPLAWYAMSKWLQNFAYRVDLGWFVFIGAAAGALVIAMATVSIQGMRAASLDPATSIRNE
ncbi:MAG: FtsX-like permease family protein [Candidatus Aminicenantes bacterium]|nr:FtsX-like permease family protein [Candidatus Aminicenantes bacterium]